MLRSIDKRKRIIAAVLAGLAVTVFWVYRHNDRSYVEPPDALGTPVSVEAFSKGYDAILEELTTPPEAEPAPITS